MNNIIMRKITVTTGYQPLVDGRLIGSVSISCEPSNAGNVLFKGDDGSDIPWIPGEWHRFHSVNLAEIQINGTAGDVVTLIGGTW